MMTCIHFRRFGIFQAKIYHGRGKFSKTAISTFSLHKEFRRPSNITGKHGGNILEAPPLALVLVKTYRTSDLLLFEIHFPRNLPLRVMKRGIGNC